MVCDSWGEGSIFFYVLTYVWLHNQIRLLWLVHSYSQIGKNCNHEFVKTPLNFVVNFCNFHFYNVMHKSMRINDSWVVSTFLWGFTISIFLLSCKNWPSFFQFFLVSWELSRVSKIVLKKFQPIFKLFFTNVKNSQLFPIVFTNWLLNVFYLNSEVYKWELIGWKVSLSTLMIPN